MGSTVPVCTIRQSDKRGQYKPIGCIMGIMSVVPATNQAASHLPTANSPRQWRGLRYHSVIVILVSRKLLPDHIQGTTGLEPLDLLLVVGVVHHEGIRAAILVVGHQR